MVQMTMLNSTPIIPIGSARCDEYETGFFKFAKNSYEFYHSCLILPSAEQLHSNVVIGLCHLPTYD